MYSYNNLEEQFAAAKDKKTCQEAYDKLKEECESYILKLRPPENEWFILGSKREFFGLKTTYYFMVRPPYVRHRSVKFAFSELLHILRQDIEQKEIYERKHIHLENIAEIIAKKKAEEALSPVTAYIEYKT